MKLLRKEKKLEELDEFLMEKKVNKKRLLKTLR